MLGVMILSACKLLSVKLKLVLVIDGLLFGISLLWIFLTYKYGDWRNWRLYYPTILFWALGDAIYNVLFCDYSLWKYKDPLLNHSLSELFTIVFVFSSATILFLSHYPKGHLRQITYILMWIGIFTGIEFIFYSLGSIVYYNSWNIGWSAVHNTYPFILLKLHHQRPLFAWCLAFLILIVMMHIFGVPLEN